MRLLDISYDQPEMNLAFDEALLDSVESGLTPETLRFWESPVPFVVLGVSQRMAEHVNEEACERDGVPILRRCSAGGCVLQGPGCLNFTLALRQDAREEIATIRGSYCYILGKVVGALTSHGVRACHEGISDLAVDGKKFSGNAQRRRKNAILHHGTLLYDTSHLDMDRYLLEPDDRPDYRGARPHGAFVACVPLAAGGLRQGLRSAFGADVAPAEPEASMIEVAQALVREKYANAIWNRRR